jgi:hypothetical protein
VETAAGTAGDTADLAATALAYYKASVTAGHVPAMQRLLRLYQEGGLAQTPAPSRASFWKLRLQMAASKAARPGAANSPITSTPQRSAR